MPLPYSAHWKSHLTSSVLKRSRQLPGAWGICEHELAQAEQAHMGGIAIIGTLLHHAVRRRSRILEGQ